MLGAYPSIDSHVTIRSDHFKSELVGNIFFPSAKEWRLQYPDKKGNISRHTAGEELLFLVNLESHNVQYIKDGLSQDECLIKVNETVIHQMEVLVNSNVLSGKGKI